MKSDRKIEIRKIEKEDYPFVLRVNEENVEVLSPMDENRLELLSSNAELALIAFVDDEAAGFLLGLREGLGFYDSENYIWFSRNYPEFLYIDRVVIDEPFRGIGLGRLFYQAVFNRAKETGVGHVTAEIDTIPYNEASLSFHQVMGFKEVGEQFIRGGSIKVSLQAVEV